MCEVRFVFLYHNNTAIILCLEQAQLRREAKQGKHGRSKKDKDVLGSNLLDVSTSSSLSASSLSPGNNSHVSPFSVAFENQKLFEGMEAGAGSFSPAGVGESCKFTI